MKRVLTAAALVPLVVYVVLGANSWIFLGVVFTVAYLSWREYDSIAARYGFGAPGILGAVAGYLFLAWQNDTWLLLALVALAAMALAMRAEDLVHALPNAALLLMGVAYIFGGWKCAILLREINPHWLMFGLLVNWAGDVGAFYAGRRLGRHRLAPRVSPAKSWEGAAASVVASVLFAGAYLMYFMGGRAIAHAIGITVAANIAGQFGDLAESAMKRGAGVKDSGTILPGHGGFLDRVDSTLFALPVVYAYLRVVGV